MWKFFPFLFYFVRTCSFLQQLVFLFFSNLIYTNKCVTNLCEQMRRKFCKNIFFDLFFFSLYQFAKTKFQPVSMSCFFRRYEGKKIESETNVESAEDELKRAQSAPVFKFKCRHYGALLRKPIRGSLSDSN